MLKNNKLKSAIILLLLSSSGSAYAESSEDIIKQLQQIKSKVEVLEKKLAEKSKILQKAETEKTSNENNFKATNNRENSILEDFEKRLKLQEEVSDKNLQNISLVERKLEIEQEKTLAGAEKFGNLEFTKKGVVFTSPDKKSFLSLRGYVQYDLREFLHDDSNSEKSEFFGRRIRPVIEGGYGNTSFRLMPDFVNTGNRVFDAHVDQKLSDHISVRAGKFKAPVSLERLQSATDLAFIERGAPTNLAPNRDFGAMVYGNILSNVIEYQAGIFNGNQDLGNTDNDDDDKKDFIARIFSLPFSNTSYVPLQNLGLGIAGSVGDREGNPTKTILGNNVSAAQQTIFRYRSGSNANTDNAYANGTQWRLYPQGYWFYKNFGLLGEYAISNVEVTRNNISDSLQNRAYQLSAGYVLTGERLNFSNRVQPFTDFDLDKGTWGAFELVARVTGTQIDDKAFPNFANITQSVKKADTVGLGVNWYLNKATKFSVDFEDTRFKGGATFGDRPDEKVILSRVQFNF